MKNSFLHGGLEEEVYLEQPRSFVAHREFGKICRLRKAFYRALSSAWFGKFGYALLDLACVVANLILLSSYATLLW